MFDRVLVHKPWQSGSQLDLGAIAETLLFYGHVDLVLDFGSVGPLVSQIGVDNFVSLVERPEVTLTFMANAAGVHSRRRNLIERHTFNYLELAKTAEGLELTTESRLATALTRFTGITPNEQQMQRVLDAVHFSRLGADTRPGAILGAMMQNDLADRDYSNRAARAVVEALLPGYMMPADWHYRLHNLDNGQYVCATNYDFDDLNARYHEVVSPEHSSLTRPYLASLLLDARVSLSLAAQYGTELVSDSKLISIIDAKLSTLLQRSTRSAEQIAAFQAMTLDNGRAVREAINQGHRDFGDFLDLLDEAERFKSWLRNAEPTTENLTHFYAEVCAASWIDKLPSKGIRFALFTGAGFLLERMGVPAMDAIGVGLGAADTFVLDSIARGWRPNQFIEQSLTGFVAPVVS